MAVLNPVRHDASEMYKGNENTNRTGDSQDGTNNSTHTQTCIEVHYQEGKGHPKIALASFPGSGNTWMRHIIQLTTGVFTGSVYHDKHLKRNGFPGEGRKDGTVIAIKTHRVIEMDNYDKAILIIRNPADAILAEFNRKKSHSQIKHAPSKLFNTSVWTKFVFNMTQEWMDFNIKWLQFSRPLLIIHYESLQQNLTHEVLQLANFLGSPINQQHLDCVLSHKDGEYKRRHTQENRHMSVFTPEMQAKLKSVLRAVQKKEDIQKRRF